MRIVLVGPPGSGKGTQGPAVAAEHGVPYLSTGDALRAQVAEGTDLGRRVGALVERGELVPDDLMVAIVAEALGDPAGRDGYVIDGFPRTVPQARAIEAPGSPLGPPQVVVHLDLPESVARERLIGRAREEGRADDADPEVVGRRLRVYAEETEPLVAHYRDRGVLVTVAADGAPDEVTAAIADALTDAVGDALTDRAID